MVMVRATKSPHVKGLIAKRVGAALRRPTLDQKQYHQSALTTTMSNVVVGNNRDEDEKTKRKHCFPPRNVVQLSQATITESRRLYHTTMSTERAPAIIMGLATLSALGFAGSSAIKSYNEWKDSQPTKEEMEEMRKREEEVAAKMKAEQQKEEEDESDKPRTNIFREWFDVGTKYYEGGFEETMTRREAALILGVRESSSPARVKDAHRRLLILNHPDTGGSTYLAGKLNEAKELLLKGKSQK